MKDIKINMNREKLSHSEIEEGKNFQQVLKGAKSITTSGAASIFKSTLFKVAAGVAVTTVVSVTLYMNYQESLEVSPQAFIDPPLIEANVQLVNYSVDATEGGVITTDRGSVITIPSGAFVDKNGNTVNGNVTIDYREMHDPVEIALSGIPMHYDSANTHYTFESAGMIDIRGYQNGEPIFIRDGEALNIDLASFDNGEDFNLYYLDTVAKKWEYVQTSPVKQRDDLLKGDTVEMVEADLQKFRFLSKMDNEMKKVERSKPAKPRKSTEGNFRITLEVEPDEFPEIAIYKGLEFEVGPENKKFNPNMLKITWDHIEIRKGVGDSYVLDIRKLNRKHSLIVYPVVSDEDYDASMKLYESKLSEYSIVKKRVLAEQEEKKAKFIAAKARYDEEMQLLIADRQARMEQMLQVSRATFAVQRGFAIPNFGTWNCDRPMRPPVGRWIIASFTDQQGKKLKMKQVFLMEKGRNAVYMTRSRNFGNLRFNPKRKNLLWGITPEGKVAAFRSEDFLNMPESNGVEYTLKMHVSSEKITSTKQAKSFLNI